MKKTIILLATIIIILVAAATAVVKSGLVEVTPNEAGLSGTQVYIQDK